MAILKIYSDITTAEDANIMRLMGSDGVCFSDVDTFVNSIPEDDGKIDIRLHCRGGLVSEGWAIYDRLRATDKEITATVEGECASMATVILLAAPKERRFAMQNATLLVHNPYILPIGEPMTADALKNESERMRGEQERILNLYVERCGCDREEMQELMNANRPINAEKAKELGLISSIIAPVSARVVSNIKVLSMEEQKEKLSVMAKIRSWLGLDAQTEEVVDETTGEVETLAMELSTADGSVLTVERENGEPQIGDKASPDGEFLMPDGRTIVVEDGVIKDIKPSEEEEKETEEEEATEDETEALKKEIEDLKAELEKAKSMAKSNEEMRILNAVKMAGGVEMLRKVGTGFTPKPRKGGRKDFAAKEQRTEVSPMRKEIEERKKGEWKKN